MSVPLSALTVASRKVGLVDVAEAIGMDPAQFVRLTGMLTESGIYERLADRVSADILPGSTNETMELLTIEFEDEFEAFILEHVPNSRSFAHKLAVSLLIDTAEKMRDIIEDNRTAVLSFTRGEKPADFWHRPFRVAEGEVTDRDTTADYIRGLAAVERYVNAESEGEQDAVA